MNRFDEKLLVEFDAKTRKGYPLGEVKQDLLELGYSDGEADAFMRELGARINEKVAGKEKRLMGTAALLLFFCGLVLYIFGARMGLWFMVVGTIWWVADFVSKKKDPAAGEPNPR